MFGKHIKRPSPEDLQPAASLPRYGMRGVMKDTVERLFSRSKALRRQAEEIEREAGQALAIMVSGEDL